MITVQSDIKAPMEKVWEFWTGPEHIVKWAFVSDDWEAPAAENDLRVGGKFKTVMAAKDKSSSFDLVGVYTEVKNHELIEYTMEGGRQVITKFEELPSDKQALEGKPEGVRIIQSFDPENENSEEMQRSGWQAILDNFKKYVENN